MNHYQLKEFTQNAAVSGLILLLVGCPLTKSIEKPSKTIVEMAQANLRPLSDSGVSGRIRFQRSESGVVISGAVAGLEANSRHGFHIHEKGDCSAAPDGTSAGGHYAPSGNPHGSPNEELHHAGDLGNIQADAMGVAKVSKNSNELSLNGAVAPILGRSVIVHENPDDLETQPAGNAGARIACGVIGVIEDKKEKN